MNKKGTTKAKRRVGRNGPKSSRALPTNAAVIAAAKSDPDAQPLTRADMKRLRRLPQAKVIRQALGLSQEDFAKRFGIPLGTLRDWEQGRAEPDAAARSYLSVIARNPDAVTKALTPAA